MSETNKESKEPEKDKKQKDGGIDSFTGLIEELTKRGIPQ